MALIHLLRDIKFWVIASLLMGVITGELPESSTIMIVSLSLLMCFSLQGLDLRLTDVRENGRKSLIAFAFSYVVASITAILISFLFIGDVSKGWLLIAAVPSAVSVIPCTLILKGDVKLSLISSTFTYLGSVLITPIITFFMLGSGADPFEIIIYCIMFICIPLMVSRPMRRIPISDNDRLLIINVLFFILVWTAFGSNRSFMITEPILLMDIAIACIFRVAIMSVVLELVMSRMKVRREERIPYVLMGTWKNTGMAMALGIVLISPEAAIPGAVSMVIEMIWLLALVRFIYPWPSTVRSSSA